MNKILKLVISIFLVFLSTNIALSKENFFNKALKMFKNEKYDEARFLLERNIVYNPKDADSYLYLAKIYNHEENQRKEEYNLETTLLIEPDNEEALLMMMKNNAILNIYYFPKGTKYSVICYCTGCIIGM